MRSSGMLRRVVLLRTNVTEELSASITMVTRIDELVHCCSYPTDSCHPDEGDAKFLRNFGSYKIHTTLTSQKTPFFEMEVILPTCYKSRVIVSTQFNRTQTCWYSPGFGNFN
jgi:hypothetical protein